MHGRSHGCAGRPVIRILLADDHPLFAEALQALVARSLPDTGLTVVSDLAGAQRALGVAPRFDLAIVDLNMPGANGLEGIRRLRAAFPDIPVVVISGAAGATEVAQALALGARGFLPKSMPSAAMAAAIQVVASGGTYVPAEYATPGEPRRPAPVGGLTLREAEVLSELVAGKSNKEIGRALGLQEITVKLHLRNIFRKLSVRNRVEAANAARALGVS